MKKFKLVCYSLLFIIMIVGNSCVACDWMVRYPPEVVWLPAQPAVIQPAPVVYPCVPQVIYQPVVIRQSFPIYTQVPVVVDRVPLWGWPNYYPLLPIRPTYIRY